MRERVVTIILGALIAGCGGSATGPSSTPVTTAGPTQSGSGITVTFQPADAAWAPVVQAHAVAARPALASFFGQGAARDFGITLLPDRALLDAHWRRIWRQPSFQSECWMIASGDASGISLLSPGAWSRDSCGHDGANSREVALVVAHETVHVHHAQRNPSFPSLQPIWWFVEGVAVYASGQHDDAVQQAHVRETVAAGRGPARLAEVLASGYATAGSLVASIDQRWGRPALASLLDETSEAGLLARLGTTEAELLAGWREHVARP